MHKVEITEESRPDVLFEYCHSSRSDGSVNQHSTDYLQFASLGYAYKCFSKKIPSGMEEVEEISISRYHSFFEKLKYKKIYIMGK